MMDDIPAHCNLLLVETHSVLWHVWWFPGGVNLTPLGIRFVFIELHYQPVFLSSDDGVVHRNMSRIIF